MKGLIALDIDGTLTVDLKPTPKEVITYLHSLVDQGWAITFVTGRTFHWGHDALKDLDFPYYYAFQNGAAIVQMPQQNLISKNYISFQKLESFNTD